MTDPPIGGRRWNDDPAKGLTPEERIERTNRQLRIAVGVFLVVVLSIVSLTGLGVYRQGERLVGIAEQNKANGDLLVDCTTPSTPSVHHECWDRLTGNDQTARTASPAIIELDCRGRRGKAGMPAPDPGTPCADQTPVEVFPG